MNKEEIEYVELRLKVPKAIVDFLRAYETAMGESAEEYLEYKIVELICSSLDDWEYSPFSDAPHWIQRFGLDKVFDEILYKPSRTVEAIEECIKQMEEHIKIKGISKGVRDLITSELQKKRAELQSLRDEPLIA